MLPLELKALFSLRTALYYDRDFFFITAVFETFTSMEQHKFRVLYTEGEWDTYFIFFLYISSF